MGTVVEGLADIKRQFSELRRSAATEWPVSVVVGFSQSYALIVHEDLEAHHTVGQAKYLESAFDELRTELIKDIQRGIRTVGLSPEKAFLRAGLWLQREAQQRTPVDTGALKASAFTSLEQNMEEAAARSKAVSDAILESVSPKTTKPKSEQPGKLTFTQTFPPYVGKPVKRSERPRFTERYSEKYAERTYKLLAAKFNPFVDLHDE